MPWESGPGDIVAGVRLASTICENGFVEEDPAGEYIS